MTRLAVTAALLLTGTALLVTGTALMLPSVASAAPFRRVLHVGDLGWDVFILQTWLDDVGLPVRADGSFDQATAQSVLRFQHAAQLSRANGRVGWRTADTLRFWVTRHRKIAGATLRKHGLRPTIDAVTAGG